MTTLQIWVWSGLIESGLGWSSKLHTIHDALQAMLDTRAMMRRWGRLRVFNVAFRHVCCGGSAAQAIYNLIARHKIERSTWIDPRSEASIKRR